jgi:DNA-binding beta-propeller fold protein YncE
MKHFRWIVLALTLGSTGFAQTINNEVFSEVVPLIHSGDITEPLDATPNSTGETVYFIARGASGVGVFQVPMSGGAATALKVGEPFVQPASLAMSSDDKWVFVADTEAQGGVIFRLSLEDSTVTMLAGTEGTAPRGLEVVALAGEDQIYFTGKLEDGQNALFKIASVDSKPTILAKGAPFENLSGITATEEGVVFVSDRGQQENQGVIYRVDNTVTPIAQNLNLGSPAGLALTPDASVLAVSSLSSDGHAQVMLINLSTLETSLFNRIIGENVSAGGLHRSHGGSEVVFAWSDYEGDQVYKVKPKKP